MDLVYRHGGSTSFERASRLAECWRDLHVVGQTVAIAPEWYPIGGRCTWGWTRAPVCANHHGTQRLPIGRPTCSDKGSDYGL